MSDKFIRVFFCVFLFFVSSGLCFGQDDNIFANGGLATQVNEDLSAGAVGQAVPSIADCINGCASAIRC